MDTPGENLPGGQGNNMFSENTMRYKHNKIYKGIESEEILSQFKFEEHFKYSPHPISLGMLNLKDDRRSLEEMGFCGGD
jgi:hypothetical protein